MSNQAIEFNGKDYRPLDLEALSMSQLVELRNLVASNIDQKRIKKFRDKEAAVRGTWTMLEKYDASFANDDAPATPTPKKTKKVKAERKKRGMYFKFPFNGKEHMRSVKNSDTLRGQCVTLLKKGATFDDVMKLVEKFDQDKGKKSERVLERAYELVRIMHYYLGYGIDHNTETDFIKLHTKEVGR